MWGVRPPTVGELNPNEFGLWCVRVRSTAAAGWPVGSGVGAWDAAGFSFKCAGSVPAPDKAAETRQLALFFMGRWNACLPDVQENKGC